MLRLTFVRCEYVRVHATNLNDPNRTEALKPLSIPINVCDELTRIGVPRSGLRDDYTGMSY